MRNNKSMIAGRFLPAIISIIILVFIDQFTKYLAEKYIGYRSSISLIDNTLELYYIRNSGAAWGILENKQILFYILTVIVLIVLLFFYIRLISFNEYNDFKILIILIFSGALGNFIDRIRFQYVIDFIYFKLINFPVFNIADTYITIGFILLIILIIFKYKEEDFDIILKNHEKKTINK